MNASVFFLECKFKGVWIYQELSDMNEERRKIFLYYILCYEIGKTILI